MELKELLRKDRLASFKMYYNNCGGMFLISFSDENMESPDGFTFYSDDGMFSYVVDDTDCETAFALAHGKNDMFVKIGGEK